MHVLPDARGRSRLSFVGGLVLGLTLSSGLSHAAGHLMGWTVEVEVRGLRIRCDDPYVWDATKEIEADDCRIE